jgi:outer membrane cobalamin receptor
LDELKVTLNTGGTIVVAELFHRGRPVGQVAILVNGRINSGIRGTTLKGA